MTTEQLTEAVITGGCVSTRRDFLTQSAALGAAGVISATIPRSDAKEATSANSGLDRKSARIPNTTLSVSRLAYGCGNLVVREDDPHAAKSVSAATQLIHTASDNGISLFDMAAMYGGGNVESTFGEVLKQSPGLRHRIVIQTKCGAEDKLDWKNTGDVPFYFDCSGQHIVESAEGSLRRLGTDYIDILLLHWPDMLLRPEEVAQAFEKLHRSGHVRYFGVSNHTVGQMVLLQKYVHQPLVISQIYMGLAHSYPIAAGLDALQESGVLLPQGHKSLGGVLDHCRLHGMQVQAYSPLQDILSNKLLNPPADATPQIKTASQTLTSMASEKNTTPLALALAWLMYHPAGIVPIIGPTKPEHVVENCKAFGVTLDREEWFKLFFATAAIQSAAAA